MADETVDPCFLAEQLKRVLGELGEDRAEQERSASLLGRVTDTVTAIAATQDHHTEVLTRHSTLFEQIDEQQRSYGGRLNIIDSRLAIIEKRIALVQA